MKKNTPLKKTKRFFLIVFEARQAIFLPLKIKRKKNKFFFQVEFGFFNTASSRGALFLEQKTCFLEDAKKCGSMTCCL
jgi:hypothetical protein